MPKYHKGSIPADNALAKELLDIGAQLDYPALNICAGESIIAGHQAWLTFMRRSEKADLQKAVTAANILSLG